MRRTFSYLGVLLITLLVGIFSWTAIRVRSSSVPAGGTLRTNWNAAAAANYLDTREVWWQGWTVSQRSQGTVCISCHTVLPYAFARPLLRAQLGETELTVNEKRMLASIEKRVADWQAIDHYYSDAAHYIPSRATESILNAVILAEYDSDLSPVTRQAFHEAWALQLTAGPNKGGWNWQDFHEAPWESSESAYQGAAMFAIALGLTPGQYSGEPDVQDHVLHLRGYLLEHYAAQPTLNQLYVMWASARIPDLLTDTQRNALIRQVTSLQNADGGWSLSVLDRQDSLKHSLLDLFKRVDGVNGSDGCATGLVVLALEEDGVPLKNPVLQRGLNWLQQHQYEDGSWWASSMNGFRDPRSYMGKFMSDAATGYATLAIERSLSLRSSPSGAMASEVRTFPQFRTGLRSRHFAVPRGAVSF